MGMGEHISLKPVEDIAKAMTTELEKQLNIHWNIDPVTVKLVGTVGQVAVYAAIYGMATVVMSYDYKENRRKSWQSRAG